jgi:iron complex outermembrane receptor protein
MSTLEMADRDPRKLRAIARLMGGIALGSMSIHGVTAHAQTAEPAEDVVEETAAETGQDQGEIVVTGTQLRGIAPVGTNVVSMSREDITATGATSANDILRTIPQVSSAFGNTPMAPPGGLSIIRPNIRGLGASGTNTTLVIVDGHRVVGAGVVQSTPDPDVIPPGVLERLDVVPDGGSSIYGSDAIGGVINYISRKRFDGFEVNARTGFADNYQTTDVNLTAGKDWDSGSAYVSYAWAHNDAIFGRDRDYVRQVTPNEGNCGAGTLFANGTSYAITGPDPDTYTAGTISGPCDVTDDVSLWPRVTRHNVFAGLSQKLTDTITLDVRGYYARRDITHFKGQEASADTSLVTITSANPFFDPIGAETSQTIRTNYLGVISDAYHNRLSSFGITPTVTAELGSDWQLRAMFNYGRSRTRTSETQINENAAIANLNFYNLASNSQSALAASVLHNFGKGNQSLVNARVIGDGTIFTLPGGSAKLAVGAEYYREKLAVATASPTAFGAEDTVPFTRRDRTVKAVFGELAVPVFGADNATPGFHALTLSASARYDDYSDVGGTFNPKLGVTYEPTDWIKVRGNWGKSFNAPSLVDTTGVTVVVPVPARVVLGQTAPGALILIGNRGADVKPQTAETWSAGIDLSPTPGLNLSATYWNVHMKREISLLAGAAVTPEVLAAGVYQDPTACVGAVTQYATFSLLNTIPLPPSLICALVFQSPNIAILDWRVQNLGEIKTDGIDFNLAYTRPVNFGTIHASVAGTYTLNRDRAIVAGAPFVDRLENNVSRLQLIATLGASAGRVNASASVSHRSGYDLDPIIAANPANPFPQAQSRVGSFTTVDAFLEYNLPESWLTPDTSLTLNVTNLFDQDPPFYNFPAFGGNSGYANGSTLGRLVQVGIRTKF